MRIFVGVLAALALGLAPVGRAAAQSPDALRSPSALATAGSEVRVWLGRAGIDDHARAGDRAYFQSARDAFVAVASLDEDGRARIVFPRSPRESARVRGGRRYEVPAGQSRMYPGFLGGRVDYLLVLASEAPLDFSYFASGAGWRERTGGRRFSDPLLAIEFVAERLLPRPEMNYAYDFVATTRDQPYQDWHERIASQDCVVSGLAYSAGVVWLYPFYASPSGAWPARTEGWDLGCGVPVLVLLPSRPRHRWRPPGPGALSEPFDGRRKGRRREEREVREKIDSAWARRRAGIDLGSPPGRAPEVIIFRSHRRLPAASPGAGAAGGAPERAVRWGESTRIHRPASGAGAAPAVPRTAPRVIAPRAAPPPPPARGKPASR